MDEIVESFYGRTFGDLSESINNWKKKNSRYVISHMSTRDITESDGCGGSFLRGTEALIVFRCLSKPTNLKLNKLTEVSRDAEVQIKPSSDEGEDDGWSLRFD